MNTITQREYNEGIKALAEDIYTEVREYGGEIQDLAFQAVDGHQWIIYTAYHVEVIDCASNPDAYQDVYSDGDLGQLVAEGGIGAVTQAQAFFAFESDLNEAVHDLAEQYKFTAWKGGLTSLNGEWS